MRRQLKRPTNLPVLSLEKDGVEWLSNDARGEPRLSMALVRGEGASALAEAAIAAVRAAGETPGRCVLALGGGLVKQKLLTLPALSRTETRTTLARKAAGLWDCTANEVAFNALSVSSRKSAPVDAKPASTEVRWLVAAVKRRETHEIRLALSKAGFRVARVVSSQLSCLARARALSGDSDASCIVVSALRRSASIVLVQGQAVVNENVLEGDLRTQPAIAMSLVQEIKSFDASWRKANRGGAVGQVVLLGLPRDRAPLFKTAVQTALPTTIVILACETGPAELDATLDYGRVEALSACRETGAFQLDLTLPLPLQPKMVAAVLGSILVTLACAATIAYRPARGAEVRELQALAASNARTRGLEDLRARNAECSSAMSKFEALAERNARVLAHGWHLGDVTAATLRALRAEAALLALDLGPVDRGEIEISGVTSANPALALLNVEGIVHSLEAGAHFTDVTSLPSGGVPNGVQPVAFTIKAKGPVIP